MPASQYLDIGGPISRYLALRIPGSALHHKLYFIQVGFALSPPSDFDKLCSLQLLNELTDARLAHPHVGREPFLAGEATVVVPGVMQEHGIGDLRTEAEVAILENEIGNLGEPTTDNGIVCR